MGIEPSDPERRAFLARVSTWFMAGGLAAGYGACAAMGARYLYPPAARERRWQFLARASEVPVGAALAYRAPSGERITVARRAAQGTPGDFTALSSTCPHLGCQVHWRPAEESFLCPCHNGAFDPEVYNDHTLSRFFLLHAASCRWRWSRCWPCTSR